MPAARRIAAALTAAALALAMTSSCATRGRIADRPARNIAGHRLLVKTSAGSGVVATYVSRDWTVRHEDVQRAIVLLHGTVGRDVFVRLAAELAGARESSRDTLLIAPQFLTDLDATTHQLPDDVLRWRLGSLGGGGDAVRPAPISTFEVLDAIFARLADRMLFPALTQIVLAGHSGGGQMAQRYAAVGRGHDVVSRAGIHARYVVANPSSFLYFSDERPAVHGGFAAFDRATCPNFNRWKYGLRRAPAYVGTQRARDVERAYARRDVVYLLGTADTDPNHLELDTSCMGNAQGPNRHARGVLYMRYLHARHPEGLNHRMWEVPAAGHDGERMLVSTCGLAALYGGVSLSDRCEP